jgi:hypothetical protein
MAQLSKRKLRIHCQWIKNQRSIKKGKEKVQDRQREIKPGCGSKGHYFSILRNRLPPTGSDFFLTTMPLLTYMPKKTFNCWGNNISIRIHPGQIS